MAQLTKAPFKRIIEEEGSNRVSTGAPAVLAAAAEKFSREVAAKAVALTEHSGRRTVAVKDIEMALSGL